MQVLNIFHVLIAIAMVAFILVQRGQGATAGAAFGSGASGTVFGARGAGSFLSHTTWILGTLFCVISLTMAVIVSRTVAIPEEDLGVIGASQAEVPVAVENTEQLPGFDDSDQDSDLPVLDTANQFLPQDEGDIPQLDSEPLTVADPGNDASTGDTDTDSGDTNPGGGG